MHVFLSYTRIKDDHNEVTRLHTRLENELVLRLPGSRVFQETKVIQPGERFADVIKREIDAADVLLILLSPSWLASRYCRNEYEYFKSAASRQGRDGLVIPLLWVPTPQLTSPGKDALAAELASVQYDDWHELRHELLGESRAVRSRISKLAQRLSSSVVPPLLKAAPIPVPFPEPSALASFADPALAIGAELRAAVPRAAQPLDVLRPFITRLFQRRSFELTREDSVSHLLYTTLAIHRVWEDEILSRYGSPEIGKIQTAIYTFEDVLAGALGLGGAAIDRVRSTLPEKKRWIAAQKEPTFTLELRSKKRDFLEQLGDALRKLGCAAPRVPRLDAEFIPSKRTKLVKCADDEHYALRISIADRPSFVTKAKYDLRHPSCPPPWTITLEEDPDLADDEVRITGNVAVKVTLYEGKAPFVEFTTWLDRALDIHYGSKPSADVRVALSEFRSR